MPAITVILALAALALALAAAGGRVPLWPSVFVLAVLELLQLWPR